MVEIKRSSSTLPRASIETNFMPYCGRDFHGEDGMTPHRFRSWHVRDLPTRPDVLTMMAQQRKLPCPPKNASPDAP